MCWWCSLWISLKSITIGIYRILESFRNTAEPSRDSNKIPQIKGCWAKTQVGKEKRGGGGRWEKSRRRERGGWGCKPMLSCPSSPPSRIRVYSEKSAACDSSYSSELAQLVGFVCTKERHLDWNYQRPRPPCLSSVQQPARDAPSCQTPATLNRICVHRAAVRPMLGV